MRSIRKWTRDVFGFSGTEINGFIILMPLMVLLIISEPLFHAWVAYADRESGQDLRMVDSLSVAWDGLRAEPVALFHFNPNTVSVDDLLKLGFSENSASRIAAYRQKGGVFRVRSDLLKIYGLDSALYERVSTFIALPESRGSTSLSLPVARRERQARPKFDINTADTLQLISVYGIGSKLAARIIKFRDGLGGFVRPEQLFEVYGLDSATVARLLNVSFISTDFTPKKLNLNTATVETLSGHPYIRYRLARLLVSYRFQHGDFRDVNDIKNLSILGKEEVERLAPYLTID
jgi:competence protein ComEA